MGYRAGRRKGWARVLAAWRWRAPLCCAVGVLACVPGCAGSSVSRGDGTSGASGAAGHVGTNDNGGAAPASCAALARCGGDPVGNWEMLTGVAGGAATSALGSACAVPILDAGNGCSDLVYLPADAAMPGINNVALPFPRRSALTRATLSLKTDHSYALQAQTTGTSELLFSAACLNAHGATPTCSEFQSQLVQFFFVEPGFSNLSCAAAPSGGCDCSWTFELFFGEEGSWQTTDSVLSLTNGNANTTVTYGLCEHADALSLTAVEGSKFIGGNVLGLRTLELQRAP